jgi:hypothetical protein
MISLTRIGELVLNSDEFTALQVVPNLARALTVTLESSVTGAAYKMAVGLMPPPGIRGSLPSSV